MVFFLDFLWGGAKKFPNGAAPPPGPLATCLHKHWVGPVRYMTISVHGMDHALRRTSVNPYRTVHL